MQRSRESEGMKLEMQSGMRRERQKWRDGRQSEKSERVGDRRDRARAALRSPVSMQSLVCSRHLPPSSLHTLSRVLVLSRLAAEGGSRGGSLSLSHPLTLSPLLCHSLRFSHSLVAQPED